MSEMKALAGKFKFDYELVKRVVENNGKDVAHGSDLYAFKITDERVYDETAEQFLYEMEKVLDANIIVYSEEFEYKDEEEVFELITDFLRGTEYEIVKES